MAIKKEIVENKIAVCYHGITVYHTHKEDDYENSPNEYIFSLDPYGSENDVYNKDDSEDSGVFDIRTLKTYDAEVNLYKNLLRAIDEGLFGETNLAARESGEDEYVDTNSGADEYICPVCGAEISPSDEDCDWGTGELTGDGTCFEYDCRCPQCGAELRQVYRLTFDGYDVL